MSRQPISRNPDLRRLLEEGYEVDIRAGYLLVKSVPYVTSKKEVAFGTLVCELSVQANDVIPPQSHVCMFAGEYPCDADGTPIEAIRHQSQHKKLALDLFVDHSFSAKPPSSKYDDYHHKMTSYAAILWSRAQAIDPSVTPMTSRVVETTPEESVFNYADTASARAKIGAVNRKLEIGKIAIIGLGGTGSYVLDLVAKTPVKEIHTFDGDTLGNHNAFRSPGAAALDDLKAIPQKVDYFAGLYSKMRRGIIPHDEYIDATNVEQLRGMDFVFLCLDRGGAKKLIAEKLQEFGTPFVEVGMGVLPIDDSLQGVLHVTTSTPQKRDHVWNSGRIGFSEEEGDDEYDTNIQIADLNALNATLAVIKWKKLFGFYRDLEHEHYCTYTIDGNCVANEDLP